MSVGIVMNGFSREALETSRSLTKNWTARTSHNIPANFRSNLVVNLPKDLNEWRLKDRLPDESKYVIYNHNLNALIEAPSGVETAFPNNPNPLFSSQCNSQESIASSCNTSSCSEPKYKSRHAKTVSTTTPTELESFNFPADTQLTKSLWETVRYCWIWATK